MIIAAGGDVHANISFVEKFYKEVAAPYNADVIVQVGDTTLAWSRNVIEDFLDQVNALAVKYGIPFYFIDGNHEDFYTLFQKYMQDHTEGFVELRANVFYIPRGFAWEWDGVRFMGFGGAFSVNYASLTEFVNWFPEEEASFSDIERALSRGEVDVLFCHDAPATIRFMDELYAGIEIAGCARNRDTLLKVCESAKPDLLIHGHHHVSYEEDWAAPWGAVKVRGLAADYTYDVMSDTYMIVDTSVF